MLGVQLVPKEICAMQKIDFRPNFFNFLDLCHIKFLRIISNDIEVYRELAHGQKIKFQDLVMRTEFYRFTNF